MIINDLAGLQPEEVPTLLILIGFLSLSISVLINDWKKL